MPLSARACGLTVAAQLNQLSSPVISAVGNTIKRVVIILASVVVFNTR